MANMRVQSRMLRSVTQCGISASEFERQCVRKALSQGEGYQRRLLCFDQLTCNARRMGGPRVTCRR